MQQDFTTIDSIFSSAALECGDHTYLKFVDGNEISYAQIYARAAQLASVMIGRGVARGDRIACLMSNRRELYEFFIATSLAGAIAVPINIQSTNSEITRIVTDCGASGFVAEASLVSQLKNVDLEQMKLRLAVQSLREGWEDYEQVVNRAAIVEGSLGERGDPCLIIYSSGTTGEPKGIVLKHDCLIENAKRVVSRLGYKSSDVFLTLLPSFHLFGYSFDFMYSGMVRASMVVMNSFSAELALDFIQRFGVSVLTGVPTMFAKMFDPRQIVGYDITSIRLLAVGGGPVSPAIKARLHSLGIQAVETYGQTEISTVAAVQVPGAPVPEGSCGPTLPDFQLRVVDDDDNDVPVGSPGELIFKSETFMQCYWNQPELTQKTLRGGWLHTGDVGRVDADGNVYILDRVKDMIVANGFNVFPKEVENAIAQHPSVLTVAVVGVLDSLRGEDVFAFVVLRPGSHATPQEISMLCVEHLARYKHPRYISIVDEVPLTATGKIRRFKLREQAENEISKGLAFNVHSAARAQTANRDLGT